MLRHGHNFPCCRYWLSQLLHLAFKISSSFIFIFTSNTLLTAFSAAHHIFNLLLQLFNSLFCTSANTAYNNVECRIVSVLIFFRTFKQCVFDFTSLSVCHFHIQHGLLTASFPAANSSACFFDRPHFTTT